MKHEDLMLVADAIDEHCVQRMEAIEARLDALEQDNRQAAESFRRVLEKLETEEVT